MLAHSVQKHIFHIPSSAYAYTPDDGATTVIFQFLLWVMAWAKPLALYLSIC